MTKDAVEGPFPPLGGMPAGQGGKPFFGGDARRAGGYENIFLEQPIPLLLEGVPAGRGSFRDKTREALITPHKRSAVWGENSDK